MLTRLGCTLFGISAGKAFTAACALGAAAFVCTARVRHQRQDVGAARTFSFLLLSAGGQRCVVLGGNSGGARAFEPTVALSSYAGDYNLQAIRICGIGAAYKTSTGRSISTTPQALMRPGGFAALAHEPALVCATALWTPLWVHSSWRMGSHALGTAGSRPSASRYRVSRRASSGPRLRPLPPQRHVRVPTGWEEISTGASYATGLSLVALVFLGMLALRNHSARAFGLQSPYLSAVIASAITNLLTICPDRNSASDLLCGRLIWAAGAALRLAWPYSALAAGIRRLLCGIALPRAPHLLQRLPAARSDAVRAICACGGSGHSGERRSISFFFAPLPLQIPGRDRSRLPAADQRWRDACCGSRRLCLVRSATAAAERAMVSDRRHRRIRPYRGARSTEHYHRIPPRGRSTVSFFSLLYAALAGLGRDALWEHGRGCD